MRVSLRFGVRTAIATGASNGICPYTIECRSYAHTRCSRRLPGPPKAGQHQRQTADLVNIYLIPSSGIFGGVKVGFQFAEMLTRLGHPCAVATPDGRAPQWFDSSVAVWRQREILPRLTATDTLLFSLPNDYPLTLGTPCRRVFHCQGTASSIDPILADQQTCHLVCWRQAARYAADRGRTALNVGISISDAFYYDGTPKHPLTVCYMPRRGNPIARQCIDALPHLRFRPMRGLPEHDVAHTLKSSEFFLATSENEYFGLPALEAMAAGCVVLSVPVLGGEEYLQDGENCRNVTSSEIAQTLASLSQPGAAPLRARLRDTARATASKYRMSRQQRHLATALQGSLKPWISSSPLCIKDTP